MCRVTLLSEDFKGFAAADFPFEPLHGAMGEYHYRPAPGYTGPWYDPIPSMEKSKTWIIALTPEGKCIEFAAKPKVGVENLQVLAAGEDEWRDYSVEMSVRNLLKDNCAGLMARYQNSRCYYMLALEGDSVKLYKRYHTELTVLAEKSRKHDPDSFFILKMDVRGSEINCYLNGERVFCVTDADYAHGRVAFGALAPAQFTDIRVEADESDVDALNKARAEKRVEVAREAAKYPQPKLWRTIDFKNFGCGRSIRFGHLLGNGELQMVLAQNQQRIFADAFAQISCLTAIDFNGNVLWQLGEANPEHAHLTADVPIQIYDIDGDGFDEVIFARDFKIWVLDGRTGNVKKCAPTPMHEGSASYLNIDRVNRYPYDRLNVDAIRVCNISGKARPSDLLIKDRYKRIYALNSDLEVLWSYDAPVNPGHFPYAKDVNGDGRDEVFVGYDLLSADGKLMWSLPIYTDHTDEIIIGKIDPDRGELIAMASGFEGFNVCDLNGKLLVRQQTGHAQRISVGNYRPDLEGLEIAMVTYWGNQGIVFMYNCKGEPLWTYEMPNNGNILSPVNWTGDGQDLLLLNGNCEKGGMLDAFRRQVVRFPNDGHPELCADAFDVTGDCRDEILLWDAQKMFVYTQDSVFKGDMISKPEKYPHYNASNYRGEYSFPNFVPYAARGEGE